MGRFNSVFSNYLVEAGFVSADETLKPSQVYDKLRSIYNQGVEGLIDNTRMFLPKHADEEYRLDVYYDMFSTPDIKPLIRWVNTRIVLTLGLTDYRTIGVRMRIATGMLNKLVYDKKVSRKLAIIIHDTLISNLNDELSAINTEDLPF